MDFRAPEGPLGPLGPPARLGRWFSGQPIFRNRCFFRKPDFGSKMVEKKVEIEGAGLSRRDPRRNSASDPGVHVENGGMATHLVTNLCDLGSVGVPAPARTPLGFKPGLPNPQPPLPPPRVCEPGPEPHPTAKHPNLPPNGSPSHFFLHPKRGPTQNFAADLAVGVPPPQSQLLPIF